MERVQVAVERLDYERVSAGATGARRRRERTPKNERRKVGVWSARVDGYAALGHCSHVAWYGSSESSRRGFCRECGSSLFFDHGPNEPIGIAAGSLDGDPPLRLAAHIYVDQAASYYSISDGVERYDRRAWQEDGWEKFRHD